MQPTNMETHHCIMPVSGDKTKWLRFVLPLVVVLDKGSGDDISHRYYFVLFLRILWLMGPRWASVINMERLPWTRENLTCVNSSEVSFFRQLQYNMTFWWFRSVMHFFCSQKKLRKWARAWLKFPSRTRSGKAPPELDPVSQHWPISHFISKSVSICMIFFFTTTKFFFQSLRKWYFEQARWYWLQTALSAG